MKLTVKTGKTSYFYHIDLLRFLFSAIIVYFHILHSNIMPFVPENSIYHALAACSNHAYILVECFFILSGIFIYRSHVARPEQPIFEYILNRIIRLWPAFICAQICEALLRRNANWFKMAFDSLFLQCMGISLDYKGILWYVSAYFWGSIFMFAILKLSSQRKSLFIISILTYFAYVFNINFANGSLGGRETVLYVVNLGMVRAIAGIGTGILLAAFHQKVSETFSLEFISPVVSRIIFVLKSIFEILLVIYILRFCLLSEPVNNHFIIVIAFSLLAYLWLTNHSILTVMLNRKSIGFVGKYAYCIYVMQQSSFLILRKTLWASQQFISCTIACLVLSTVFSVVVGIAVHYMVEMPCVRLYEKFHKKYTAIHMK